MNKIKTIVLAAVKTNILLLINLDLITVLPDPELSIFSSCYKWAVNIKYKPKEREKNNSKKSIVRKVD